MPIIRQHSLHLCGTKTKLRPFTDADLAVAYRWNQDPEVLYYSEGDEVACYSLADIQGIYRSMSEQGYLFIIETLEGLPIGEACLQWMNLDRANVQPSEKVMRSPIMIGQRKHWGKGYGRDVIATLMRYAFLELGIDRFCAMGISAFNQRSLRMFRSLGLRQVRRIPDSIQRGEVLYDEIDLEIARGEFIILPIAVTL